MSLSSTRVLRPRAPLSKTITAPLNIATQPQKREKRPSVKLEDSDPVVAEPAPKRARGKTNKPIKVESVAVAESAQVETIKAEPVSTTIGTDTTNSATTTTIIKTAPVSIKVKKVARKTADNPYGIVANTSPYPEFGGPSHEKCHVVYTLLTGLHGEFKPPAVIPPPSITVTGCGEVPSVLDAVLRTMLSGATTMVRSNLAIASLAKRYGILDSGVGKGSINWEKVRAEGVVELEIAIHCGGLAKLKSKHMIEVLETVRQQNLDRHALAPKGEAEPTPESLLSLDRLHNTDAHTAMRELVRLPGVGLKTASCVALFCLRKPSFAVDTHVLRMSGWLGWIPVGANMDDAFHHLDSKVPDELKYGLHQLFIKHGQTCVRCQASTAEGSDSWGLCTCPLEDLINRAGKKKLTVKKTVKTVLGDSDDFKPAKVRTNSRAAKKAAEAKDGKHNTHGIE